MSDNNDLHLQALNKLQESKPDIGYQWQEGVGLVRQFADKQLGTVPMSVARGLVYLDPATHPVAGSTGAGWYDPMNLNAGPDKEHGLVGGGVRMAFDANGRPTMWRPHDGAWFRSNQLTGDKRAAFYGQDGTEVGHINPGIIKRAWKGTKNVAASAGHAVSDIVGGTVGVFTNKEDRAGFGEAVRERWSGRGAEHASGQAVSEVGSVFRTFVGKDGYAKDLSSGEADAMNISLSEIGRRNADLARRVTDGTMRSVGASLDPRAQAVMDAVGGRKAKGSGATIRPEDDFVKALKPFADEAGNIQGSMLRTAVQTYADVERRRLSGDRTADFNRDLTRKLQLRAFEQDDSNMQQAYIRAITNAVDTGLVKGVKPQELANLMQDDGHGGMQLNYDIVGRVACEQAGLDPEALKAASPENRGKALQLGVAQFLEKNPEIRAAAQRMQQRYESVQKALSQGEDEKRADNLRKSQGYKAGGTIYPLAEFMVTTAIAGRVMHSLKPEQAAGFIGKVGKAYAVNQAGALMANGGDMIRQTVGANGYEGVKDLFQGLGSDVVMNLGMSIPGLHFSKVAKSRVLGAATTAVARGTAFGGTSATLSYAAKSAAGQDVTFSDEFDKSVGHMIAVELGFNARGLAGGFAPRKGSFGRTGVGGDRQSNFAMEDQLQSFLERARDSEAGFKMTPEELSQKLQISLMNHGTSLKDGGMTNEAIKARLESVQSRLQGAVATLHERNPKLFAAETPAPKPASAGKPEPQAQTKPAAKVIDPEDVTVKPADAKPPVMRKPAAPVEPVAAPTNLRAPAASAEARPGGAEDPVDAISPQVDQVSKGLDAIANDPAQMQNRLPFIEKNLKIIESVHPESAAPLRARLEGLRQGEPAPKASAPVPTSSARVTTDPIENLRIQKEVEAGRNKPKVEMPKEPLPSQPDELDVSTEVVDGPDGKPMHIAAAFDKDGRIHGHGEGPTEEAAHADAIRNAMANRRNSTKAGMPKPLAKGTAPAPKDKTDAPKKARIAELARAIESDYDPDDPTKRSSEFDELRELDPEHPVVKRVWKDFRELGGGEDEGGEGQEMEAYWKEHGENVTKKEASPESEEDIFEGFSSRMSRPGSPEAFDAFLTEVEGRTEKAKQLEQKLSSPDLGEEQRKQLQADLIATRRAMRGENMDREIKSVYAAARAADPGQDMSGILGRIEDVASANGVKLAADSKGVSTPVQSVPHGPRKVAVAEALGSPRTTEVEHEYDRKLKRDELSNTLDEMIEKMDAPHELGETRTHTQASVVRRLKMLRNALEMGKDRQIRPYGEKGETGKLGLSDSNAYDEANIHRYLQALEREYNQGQIGDHGIRNMERFEADIQNGHARYMERQARRAEKADAEAAALKDLEEKTRRETGKVPERSEEDDTDLEADQDKNTVSDPTRLARVVRLPDHARTLMARHEVRKLMERTRLANTGKAAVLDVLSESVRGTLGQKEAEAHLAELANRHRLSPDEMTALRDLAAKEHEIRQANQGPTGKVTQEGIDALTKLWNSEAGHILGARAGAERSPANLMGHLRYDSAPEAMAESRRVETSVMKPATDTLKAIGADKMDHRNSRGLDAAKALLKAIDSGQELPAKLLYNWSDSGSLHGALGVEGNPEGTAFKAVTYGHKMPAPHATDSRFHTGERAVARQHAEGAEFSGATSRRYSVSSWMDHVRETLRSEGEHPDEIGQYLKSSRASDADALEARGKDALAPYEAPAMKAAEPILQKVREAQEAHDAALQSELVQAIQKEIDSFSRTDAPLIGRPAAAKVEQLKAQIRTLTEPTAKRLAQAKQELANFRHEVPEEVLTGARVKVKGEPKKVYTPQQLDTVVLRDTPDGSTPTKQDFARGVWDRVKGRIAAIKMTRAMVARDAKAMVQKVNDLAKEFPSLVLGLDNQFLARQIERGDFWTHKVFMPAMRALKNQGAAGDMKGIPDHIVEAKIEKQAEQIARDIAMRITPEKLFGVGPDGRGLNGDGMIDALARAGLMPLDRDLNRVAFDGDEVRYGNAQLKAIWNHFRMGGEMPKGVLADALRESGIKDSAEFRELLDEMAKSRTNFQSEGRIRNTPGLTVEEFNALMGPATVEDKANLGDLGRSLSRKPTAAEIAANPHLANSGGFGGNSGSDAPNSQEAYAEVAGESDRLSGAYGRFAAQRKKAMDDFREVMSQPRVLRMLSEAGILKANQESAGHEWMRLHEKAISSAKGALGTALPEAEMERVQGLLDAARNEVKADLVDAGRDGKFGEGRYATPLKTATGKVVDGQFVPETEGTVKPYGISGEVNGLLSKIQARNEGLILLAEADKLEASGNREVAVKVRKMVDLADRHAELTPDEELVLHLYRQSAGDAWKIGQDIVAGGYRFTARDINEFLANNGSEMSSQIRAQMKAAANHNVQGEMGGQKSFDPDTLTLDQSESDTRATRRPGSLAEDKDAAFRREMGIEQAESQGLPGKLRMNADKATMATAPAADIASDLALDQNLKGGDLKDASGGYALANSTALEAARVEISRKGGDPSQHDIIELAMDKLRQHVEGVREGVGVDPDAPIAKQGLLKDMRLALWEGNEATKFLVDQYRENLTELESVVQEFTGNGPESQSLRKSMMADDSDDPVLSESMRFADEDFNSFKQVIRNLDPLIVGQMKMMLDRGNAGANGRVNMVSGLISLHRDFNAIAQEKRSIMPGVKAVTEARREAAQTVAHEMFHYLDTYGMPGVLDKLHVNFEAVRESLFKGSPLEGVYEVFGDALAAGSRPYAMTDAQESVLESLVKDGHAEWRGDNLIMVKDNSRVAEREVNMIRLNMDRHMWTNSSEFTAELFAHTLGLASDFAAMRKQTKGMPKADTLMENVIDLINGSTSVMESMAMAHLYPKASDLGAKLAESASKPTALTVLANRRARVEGGIASKTSVEAQSRYLEQMDKIRPEAAKQSRELMRDFFIDILGEGRSLSRRGEQARDAEGYLGAMSTRGRGVSVGERASATRIFKAQRRKEAEDEKKSDEPSQESRSVRTDLDFSLAPDPAPEDQEHVAVGKTEKLLNLTGKREGPIKKGFRLGKELVGAAYDGATEVFRGDMDPARFKVLNGKGQPVLDANGNQVVRSYVKQMAWAASNMIQSHVCAKSTSDPAKDSMPMLVAGTNRASQVTQEAWRRLSGSGGRLWLDRTKEAMGFNGGDGKDVGFDHVAWANAKGTKMLNPAIERYLDKQIPLKTVHSDVMGRLVAVEKASIHTVEIDGEPREFYVKSVEENGRIQNVYVPKEAVDIQDYISSGGTDEISRAGLDPKTREVLDNMMPILRELNEEWLTQELGRPGVNTEMIQKMLDRQAEGNFIYLPRIYKSGAANPRNDHYTLEDASDLAEEAPVRGNTGSKSAFEGRVFKTVRDAAMHGYFPRYNDPVEAFARGLRRQTVTAEHNEIIKHWMRQNLAHFGTKEALSDPGQFVKIAAPWGGDFGLLYRMTMKQAMFAPGQYKAAIQAMAEDREIPDLGIYVHKDVFPVWKSFYGRGFESSAAYNAYHSFNSFLKSTALGGFFHATTVFAGFGSTLRAATAMATAPFAAKRAVQSAVRFGLAKAFDQQFRDQFREARGNGLRYTDAINYALDGAGMATSLVARETGGHALQILLNAHAMDRHSSIMENPNLTPGEKITIITALKSGMTPGRALAMERAAQMDMARHLLTLKDLPSVIKADLLGAIKTGFTSGTGVLVKGAESALNKVSSSLQGGLVARLKLSEYTYGLSEVVNRLYDPARNPGWEQRAYRDLADPNSQISVESRMLTDHIDNVLGMASMRNMALSPGMRAMLTSVKLAYTWHKGTGREAVKSVDEVLSLPGVRRLYGPVKQAMGGRLRPADAPMHSTRFVSAHFISSAMVNTLIAALGGAALGIKDEDSIAKRFEKSLYLMFGSKKKMKDQNQNGRRFHWGYTNELREFYRMAALDPSWLKHNITNGNAPGLLTIGDAMREVSGIALSDFEKTGGKLKSNLQNMPTSKAWDTRIMENLRPDGSLPFLQQMIRGVGRSAIGTAARTMPIGISSDTTLKRMDADVFQRTLGASGYRQLDAAGRAKIEGKKLPKK